MNNIFDNIDNSINPCDDFYGYATGKWLENNPQPEEYPSWNTFMQLNDINIKRINDIILNGDDSAISKKIHDYYEIIMNYDRRNKEKLVPVKRFMESLKSLKTNEDIILSSASNNIEIFFNTYLEPDSKGSGKYEVAIGQGGLGLGNKDYYQVESENNIKIRQAYFKYIKDLSNYCTRYGFSFDDNLVLDMFIWDIECKLAKVSYSAEEMQDPILNYNKMEVTELSRITKFDWKSYLTALGYNETDTVIVNNLDFLIYACNLLKTMDFNKLYSLYCWNIIGLSTNKLTDDIYDIDFEFGKVFNGAITQMPKWKRAINTVNNIFSDAIGQIYVKKYFNEESKLEVINLVNNLKKSFHQIINEQTWMTNETKEKALEKLSSMTLKIGYPDEWEDFSDIPVDTSLSYFENYINVRKYIFKKDLEKHYNKEIDRNEWYMPAQMINAYYDQIQNEICFPAGILQYPFYDINRSQAENYGAIGVIIGHEMTHAFDNHGRLYDKDGVLKDWWTTEDSEKFNELVTNTKEHFNNIEAIPGVMCNGSLTLGENLADYGGIKIAYNAYMLYLKRWRSYVNEMRSSGFFDIDYVEDNDWQNKFFIAYANDWAGVTTDEAIMSQITTNEHSIERLRVNGTLPMFTPWEDYYNVNKCNKLYVDIDKRAKIW